MISRTCTIFVNLWLVHVARATTFKPNCTLPPEGTNYVAGSNVRSTLDIFWSALYTIFVCTWAVQHLNVPPQEKDTEAELAFNDAIKEPTRLWESTCKSLAGLPASTSKFLKDLPASTRKLWGQTWRRLKWMLITIVLPEFLLGRAMGDFIAAHRFAKNLKGGWTATHGFYANSGGFVLRLRSSSRIVAVDTAQLDYLVKEKKLISTRPPITKAEILEKSQGDAFATLSAMVQLLWLVIQLIVRKVNNLHSSQLEIAALSFAVCSFITYALWWEKPQNPTTPTMIHLELDNLKEYEKAARAKDEEAARAEDEEAVPAKARETCWAKAREATRAKAREEALAKDEETAWAEAGEKHLIVELEEPMHGCFFKNSLFPSKDTRTRVLAEVIPNDRYNSDSTLFIKQLEETEEKYRVWGITGEDLGFLIGAVILGACHCIAWNFAFPTPIERTLWRAAAGIITGIMPLYYVLWFTFALLIPRFKVDSEFAETVLAWLSYMVYGVCRLYLLGAAFRELFFLPPGAFVATWSVSFPHFG